MADPDPGASPARVRASRSVGLAPVAAIIVCALVQCSSGGSATPAFGAVSPAVVPAPPSLGAWTAISPASSFDLSGWTPALASTTVVGSLTFQARDPTGQEQLLQDLYTPGSPGYHQFLTGDQWDALFGPDPTTQDALLSYLQSHGVQVEVSSSLLWTVQGPASAMGSAFGTSFLVEGANYAPAGPLSLPTALAGGVSVNSGFQTLDHPSPSDLLPAPHPLVTARAVVPGANPALQEAPLTAITLNMTNPFLYQYQKAGGVFMPPTQVNLSWTLTISGGTAPYSVSWHWGDGSMQKFTTSASSLAVVHEYYQPSQSDECGICGNITVIVNDSASPVDTKTYHAYLIPGQSPWGDELFYNAVPLYRLGDSGTGTRIGFDEMCDVDFSNYVADFNTFSAEYGLPQNSSTDPVLYLVGSGKTTCTASDYAGWAGETMLDIEWAHALAPNATLYVDLSNSAIDEGDSTWSNTAYGIYVASNSWGCPQNGTGTADFSGCPTRSAYTTLWQKLALQGQTFMASSGDCGAYSVLNAWPATIPWGMGVGGTDVYPFPAGTFRLEVAWNGSSATTGATCVDDGDNDDGSTGGCSTLFNSPWYQLGMTGFPGACATGDRGVPDVASIGGTWVSYYNPEVYDITGGTSGWGLEAGTSLACPSFAALLDLIYQYNGTATKANGLADFDLYAIAKSSNYAIGIHDITLGGNKVGGTGYLNTAGWNPVDGLGSANIAQLAQLMAAQNGNPDPYSPLTVVLASNLTFVPGSGESLVMFFGADVAGGPSSLSGYSYTWTFGDGSTTTTTVPYVVHTYTCTGLPVASVSVTAGSDTGVSNSITVHPIYGSACPVPLTAGSYTDNRSANACETTCVVNVNATYTGGTGAITATFLWGDGSAPEAVTGASGIANAWHAYAPASKTTFAPTVFINDSASHSVEESPTSSLTVYPLLQLSPLVPSVWRSGTGVNETFQAASAVAGTGSGTLSTISWRYGNGESGSGAAGLAFVLYTIANPTGYNVVVNATDSLGYKASVSLLLPVYGTATAVHLYEGWNLIALPSGVNDYTLFDLSQVVGSHFASIEDLATGVTYNPGSGPTDGDSLVSVGNALWVETTGLSGPEVIQLYGNATAVAASLTANAWSAVGWSVAAGTTGAGLTGAGFAGASLEYVSFWNASAQAWNTYAVALDGSDWLSALSVYDGEAVLLWSSATGTFNE